RFAAGTSILVLPVLPGPTLVLASSAENELTGPGRTTVETEFVGDGLQSLDAESNVLVQINTQSRRALNNVVAVHLAGEGLIFHPFSHRLGVDLGERLTRLDQRNGGDKSGEFVAGEK